MSRIARPFEPTRRSQRRTLSGDCRKRLNGSGTKAARGKQRPRTPIPKMRRMPDRRRKRALLMILRPPGSATSTCSPDHAKAVTKITNRYYLRTNLCGKTKKSKRSTQRSQRKVIQKQKILCGLCVKAFRLRIFRTVFFVAGDTGTAIHDYSRSKMEDAFEPRRRACSRSASMSVNSARKLHTPRAASTSPLPIDSSIIGR
jgi:hypothetical protein